MVVVYSGSFIDWYANCYIAYP